MPETCSVFLIIILREALSWATQVCVVPRGGVVDCLSKDSLARHLTCIGMGGGPRGFCRLLVQRFCQWGGLATGLLVTSGPGAGVYWKNIELFRVLEAA